jgi:hypothetical protein
VHALATPFLKQMMNMFPCVHRKVCSNCCSLVVRMHESSWNKMPEQVVVAVVPPIWLSAGGLTLQSSGFAADGDATPGITTPFTHFSTLPTPLPPFVQSSPSTTVAALQVPPAFVSKEQLRPGPPGGGAGAGPGAGGDVPPVVSRLLVEAR